MDLVELLQFVVKSKASDLHLAPGMPPMIRVHGEVRRLNQPPLEHKDVHDMVFDVMNDNQRKVYQETLECDFSFEVPNVARFRVNVLVQNGGAGAVLRTVPTKIQTLEELHAPKTFAELAEKPRGLVLVTGPTGSGKSTTLAAMVDHINSKEYGHIITIEDPIEFVHPSKNCLVRQRELGPHTLSYANALRAAPREAPDEVMVCNSAIRNLIRENKNAQIYALLPTQGEIGNQTLDQALTALVRRNAISAESAKTLAVKPDAIPLR